jgi:carbon storage regulator CsrA
MPMAGIAPLACHDVGQACASWRQSKELDMLVLSRKVGQRIHVGDEIVLEIRRISGNRVTLALDAPRGVRILRGELERAAREFDARPDETPDETMSSSVFDAIIGPPHVIEPLPR